MMKGNKKMIFKKIKYYYQKRNRYLESYLQDIISEATGFEPYEIKVKTASKEPESRKDFNCFTFYYQGMDYTLKDGKLQMTHEID